MSQFPFRPSKPEPVGERLMSILPVAPEPPPVVELKHNIVFSPFTGEVIDLADILKGAPIVTPEPPVE